MNKLNSSTLFIVVIVMTIQFNFIGTAFGQEAVDLGLPSGLLWSDRNVGAYDDCDCGDYFSYGETDSKSKYTWDTYEYRSGSDEQLSISKYVDNNPYLYKLDAEADPAAVEWGEGWHVPTRGDFLELLDKCDIKIVNDYKGTGVRGLLVYNRKDRSKFIFIAGCGFKKGFERINTSLHKNGHVKLWTATANLKYDANQAFYFVADDGNGGGGHTYGNILEEDFCIGMNMRGVREKTQAEIEKAKIEETRAENELKLLEPAIKSYAKIEKVKIQYETELENISNLSKAAFRNRNNPEELSRINNESEQKKSQADKTKQQIVSEYETVVKYCDNKITDNPQINNLQFLVALLHYQMSEIIRIERDAILGKDDPDGSKTEAKQTEMRKYYSLSAQAFEKCLKTIPDDKDCLENLGKLYTTLGNSDKANEIQMKLNSLSVNSKQEDVHKLLWEKLSKITE